MVVFCIAGGNNGGYSGAGRRVGDLNQVAACGIVDICGHTADHGVQHCSEQHVVVDLP